MRKFKLALILGTVLVSLSPFQNCGQGFKTDAASNAIPALDMDQTMALEAVTAASVPNAVKAPAAATGTTSSTIVTSSTMITSGGLVVRGRHFYERLTNKKVILKSMNWEGFNDRGLLLHGLEKRSLDQILTLLKSKGFNSLRIPFANAMLRSTTPVTNAATISLNPFLAQLTPPQAFVELVNRITASGFYVILDNHQTSLDFYDEGVTDSGDGLWFSSSFSESAWLADWSSVAQLFKDNNGVIGYELRNEVRGVKNADGSYSNPPVWGGGGALDWRRAQIAAAKVIWAVNKSKIAFLSGTNFNFYLGGAYSAPITKADFPPALVSASLQIAYSVHVYGWLQPWSVPGYENNIKSLHQYSTAQMSEIYGRSFGFLVVENKAYTAPVWISEFGIAPLYNTASSSVEWEYWYHFNQFTDYMKTGELSFAYYTMSSYYSKNTASSTYDCYAHAPDFFDPAKKAEYESKCNSYGLFNRDWTAFADDWRFAELAKIL